jgi:hypothetical protein
VLEKNTFYRIWFCCFYPPIDYDITLALPIAPLDGKEPIFVTVGLILTCSFRVNPLLSDNKTSVRVGVIRGSVRLVCDHLYLKHMVTGTKTRHPKCAWSKHECRLDYLQENLSQNLIRLNEIMLFVWIGFCNLTTKSDGFIELASTNSNSAFELVNILKQIYHFVRTFGPSVKLVLTTDSCQP